MASMHTITVNGMPYRVEEVTLDPDTGWYDCPECDDSYDTKKEAEDCQRWCVDFGQECEDLMTPDPNEQEDWDDD
jgi:hypothetical protein